MTSRARSEHVAIIGGGLGGLASACTLAARGYAVTLIERNDWTGGKAAVLDDGGFHFDMGPTILTLPTVLERIFAEAGRSLSEEVKLVRLDPQWRCFFDDGSSLDLCEKIDAMSETLDGFAPGLNSGSHYRDFIGLSKRLHEISDRFFFWRPIGSVADMFTAKSAFDLSGLRDVLALRMGRSVAGTIRASTPDPRVAQMLDHFTQYVGSAPDQSPAVLCGIAHMQTDGGVWYPMGGTAAVPAALTRLARDLGVRFVLGSEVTKIRVEGKRAVGVETADGQMIAADAVVSNMDSVRTFRELIEGKPARRFAFRHRRAEPACSGVVLYLGLSKAYPHLLHHNFIFSRDPHEEFEAIYRRGELAPDPTCYVCAPARTEPGVAPAGGEALYVLVHTPYLRPNHDWKQMLPAYRDRILDKLARTANMPDLRQRIVVEHALTPQDIHERYRVLNGAIYGLASHGKFFGAFKPSNRSRDLQGLYLSGGSAHPGPGMPMVLMSGWIAADALDRDLSSAAAPSPIDLSASPAI